MQILRRRLADGWWVQLLIAAMSLSLIVGAAVGLYASQAAAHRGVEDRFAAKSGLSANFVATFVDQLTTREKQVASRTLTGPHPSSGLASAVAAFGFQAGILLDRHGRALSTAPFKRALIGQRYDTKYPHIKAALHGYAAVSDVVISAVEVAPVVAFAVPFHTSQGVRVFSGAYAVTDTPLSAFLKDATTLSGARLYLVDAQDTVLASNGKPLKAARTLAHRNPELDRAAEHGPEGDYRSASQGYHFAQARVAGTPWTLLSAAPDSQLFVAINGRNHWLPWLILVILSLLIVVAAWLAIRLLAGRRHLADLNHRLANLARTDALTGLSNRLHLTEQLAGLLANAARQAFDVTVLMIDIDHFKSLNDTFGHQAGDEALRSIAQRLRTSLRDGDLLARWGGEEFLAVLPHTPLQEGLEVAERLRHLVAATPIEIGPGGDHVVIHTSVGVAAAADDSLNALVNRADLGLYAAKAAGRNTISSIAMLAEQQFQDLAAGQKSPGARERD